MIDQVVSGLIQFVLTSSVLGFVIKSYIGKIDGCVTSLVQIKSDIHTYVASLTTSIELVKKDITSLLDMKDDVKKDHDTLVTLMHRVETAFKDINAQHVKIREQDAKLAMFQRRFSNGGE